MIPNTTAPRYGLCGTVQDRQVLFSLRPGRQVLGSGHSCDLRIAARGVSRQHAEIVLGLVGMRLEDAGSKNGTFRNGQRVDSSELLPGDRLLLGSAELEVTELDAAKTALAISLPILNGDETPTEAGLVSSWGPALGTTDLGPAGGDLPAAELADRLLRLLDLPGKCTPETVVELLYRSLRPRGLAAVRWVHGSPLVLASRGPLEDLPSDGPLRFDLQQEPLSMLLWEDAANLADADLPIRVALLMIALLVVDDRPRLAPRMSGPAPGGSPPAGPVAGSSSAGLRFPEEYVPATSPAMDRVYREMAALARALLPVLVQGETGVGKEWIARILHRSSARRNRPFVAINCAAIPADLMEAEFFGIEKGIATGVNPRPGKFLEAEGGTLFLDEIGEMEPALQAKLLRALQEKEVLPVGGRPRGFDVWVISATNADLEQRIAAGRFRQDLYFRLAGFALRIPSLRECREDIPALVRHFLHTFSRGQRKPVRGLTVQALQGLMAYDWPGNIRQLEHEVRALVYRGLPGEVIDTSALSPQVLEAATGKGPPEEPGTLALDTALDAQVRDLERRLVTEALHQTGGVQRRAARILCISRNRLAKKMKDLGIAERIS